MFIHGARLSRHRHLRAQALLALSLAAACAPSSPTERGRDPVPVVLAPVEQGPISERRTLSGALEASSRIEVATMVGGRLAELAVDLGDPVERGQVVARLDREELAQAVRQAEAEVAVAEADLGQAVVQAELATRELERERRLHEQGATAAATLDEAETSARTREASVAVARAQVLEAQAALAAARARLEDAVITATWSGEDARRVVASRHVDEGSVVAANTTLLTIVDLDPLRAVVHVAERDLSSLAPGQEVALRTDAWPGRDFPATVDRVAPVFDADSRQARVELAVPNAEGALRPGLYVRAEVVLRTEPDAIIVPEEALVERGGQPAVFVAPAEGDTVALVPVEVGVRDAGRVQVRGEGVQGRVVVIGQQLLQDGARVVVPGGEPAEAP